MKKKLLLCVFLTIICMVCAFTEDIVLKRNVSTQDNPYFNESGTVSIYLHEYTNPEGKRFGFVYKIDLNETKSINLESIRKNPLVYYIDEEKSSFYIGRIWNKDPRPNFLNFSMDDGYNVYFMYVYAVAVSSHLSNSDSNLNNTLIIKEPSEVIPNINLLSFNGYREYRGSPSKICININDKFSIHAFRDIGTDILESLKRNGISLSDDGIIEIIRNDNERMFCNEMFRTSPCPHAQHEKDYLLIDYEAVVLQKYTD